MAHAIGSQRTWLFALSNVSSHLTTKLWRVFPPFYSNYGHCTTTELWKFILYQSESQVTYVDNWGALRRSQQCAQGIENAFSINHFIFCTSVWATKYFSWNRGLSVCGSWAGTTLNSCQGRCQLLVVNLKIYISSGMHVPKFKSFFNFIHSDIIHLKHTYSREN